MWGCTGVWNYAKTPRNKWIMDSLGMVTLAGSQVWWTWETEDSFRQVREGDKHAVQTYGGKLTHQLGQLTGMVSGHSCVVMALEARMMPPACKQQVVLCAGLARVGCALAIRLHAATVYVQTQVRSDLSADTRRKVNTLIITDVHARGIIDKFVRDSIMDAGEFAWESQLRFYWDRALVRAGSCQ